MKRKSLILVAIVTCCALSDLRGTSAQKRSAPGTQTKTSDNELHFSIPDVEVYDQNGKQLKFNTDLIKGKTVAINFIFTTCTTICPPLTSTFRRVQVEAGPNVNLISVSVDPTTDNPERLRAYADKFKAGPGWTFVTGKKADIDKLLVAFGTAVADKNDHTPMILIGSDPANYWTRAYGLSPATQLAAMIKAAAERKAAQTQH
jgi:cytochrome oxidase Cu insertion factor (SCO1/SenC/PrrC family)